MQDREKSIRNFRNMVKRQNAAVVGSRQQAPSSTTSNEMRVDWIEESSCVYRSRAAFHYADCVLAAIPQRLWPEVFQLRRDKDERREDCLMIFVISILYYVFWTNCSSCLSPRFLLFVTNLRGNKESHCYYVWGIHGGPQINLNGFQSNAFPYIVFAAPRSEQAKRE